MRNITVNGATVATDVVGLVYAENNFNAQLGDVGITSIATSTNTCNVDITNASAVFAVNKAYVVDDGSSPVIVICTAVPNNTSVRFDNGDQLGINVHGTTGTLGGLNAATPNAACRELNWIEYYVDDNRTLIRRSFGSQSDQIGNGVATPSTYPGYVEMPLAFNVEDFQVQYILDTGDTLDTIAADTDWQRIRMVRLTVTIASPELDSKTGQRIRETVSTVYFTRNLANQERPPAS